MAKIRVLHCCNILDLGGEKSILVHSKYADKTRFEVFACGRLYGGRRVPEFEKLGISVYVAPLSAIGRFHPRVVETFGCVIAGLIRSDVTGVIHAGGEGECSRYEFAKAILQEAGLGCRVVPISTAESGRLARRPPYSALSAAFLHQHGLSLPPRREGVRQFLADQA